MERVKSPIVLLCGVVLNVRNSVGVSGQRRHLHCSRPFGLKTDIGHGRKPAPYLLAVAMASNAGSTATITGNPQNIVISSLSHIPYNTFAIAMAPIAVFGMAVTVASVALFNRTEFGNGQRLRGRKRNIPVNRVLVIRALLATIVMMALFFSGEPPAKAAIIVAGILLLTRRMKNAWVYADI
jgi:Na+/H+ antiporter NhaD/arsenite permease-like protein